ncbi:nucleotidyltransferase domain-containing protein [Bacillus sp. 2205SS5-2]|uniref:nucleotidyltransferase domain-containing protein n=1 Tax=Bacillus sp. 2205SS5-2 TaxID=3109031 RepID=UPI0030058B97
MNSVPKLDPFLSAEKFIITYYSSCQGAILAGSVVRGEHTSTSDLDIVIFDQSVPSSYRESLHAFGWPIEVFVHNLTSYKQFFLLDHKAARPSMQKMISEGLVIKDEGILEGIKQEANAQLAQGPDIWTDQEIRFKRYFITDTLDDFIGASERGEQLFIANHLASLLHEFVLRTNRRWIGSSKWIIRALNSFDENFTEEFVKAFDHFYKSGDKSAVISLSEKILDPFGGLLFEGFSLGKGE